MAVSCTNSPMGHVQCDNGTLVIGTHALLEERQGRRFADVVGAGFEGEPPHGDRPPLQLTAEVRADLFEEHVLLRVIDFVHRFEDPRFDGHVDSRTQFETRSILCAPLVSRGRAIGVLEILNKLGLTMARPRPVPPYSRVVDGSI